MNFDMQLFLSDNTIIKAYENLTDSMPSESVLLREFLLLKLTGISKTNSIDTSTAFLDKKYLSNAFLLLSLYALNEKAPDNKNFINPLSMKSWKGHPTETFRKWATARIKNNISGGAVQWRSILVDGKDISSNNTQGLSFRLSYRYIEFLKKFTNNYKMDLSSLAIWYHRFISFDKPMLLINLVENFCKIFNITDEEKYELFYIKNYSLDFSETSYNTFLIRQRIEQSIAEDLAQSIYMTINEQELINADFVINSFKFPKSNELPTMTEDEIYTVLREYKQIILAGAPGTSKSYIAKEIAKNKFNGNFTQIQFHPQYKYQDFVGGYVVEGDHVSYQNGVMLNLLDSIGDEEHLLIIDEVNRANITQVFGEFLQLLDRTNELKIKNKNGDAVYSLPPNLYIIATLNTTDRSLARLDYAFKRRFAEIYISSNPLLLNDLVDTDGFIPLGTFLLKVNNNLVEVTNDKEMILGHALFLSEHVLNKEDGKFEWNYKTFKNLFNYKILPIVEDYCGHDLPTVQQVLGEKLATRKTDEQEFKEALLEFMGMVQ